MGRFRVKVREVRERVYEIDATDPRAARYHVLTGLRERHAVEDRHVRLIESDEGYNVEIEEA